MSDGVRSETCIPASAAVFRQNDANPKKRRKLAPVSVRILAVLSRANFRALCSCLNLANRIAVMESEARIPPTYMIQLW